MIHKKFRYEFLSKQFQIDNSCFLDEEMKKSLDRIFSFVYNHTTILHIEFIDEKVLQNYIIFHKSRGFSEIDISGTLKDIKSFIGFLANIKKAKHLPKVDLSINNFYLWLQL